MDHNLQGITVLVTRPLHQQSGFIAQLEAMRASAISLPCLQIRWLNGRARSQLHQLETGQIVIFTSPNAVHAANELQPMPWHGGFTLLAIGPSTADTLRSYSMQPDTPPVAPYNSESLLSLPQLQQVNLQKVSIIKGCGGRELLEKSLAKQAVSVESIEVYERLSPNISKNTLDRVFLKSALDIVTITSNEALQNLFDAVDTRKTERHKKRLLALPLIVNSQRAAQLAKDLCFQSHVLVAPAAGDAGQLEAIKLWSSSYRFTL